jgi:hypothetical protein
MMLLKLLLCGSNPSALLAATMACAKGCSEKFQFQYTAVLGWFRWENIRKRLGIHKWWFWFSKAIAFRAMASCISPLLGGSIPMRHKLQLSWDYKRTGTGNH